MNKYLFLEQMLRETFDKKVNGFASKLSNQLNISADDKVVAVISGLLDTLICDSKAKNPVKASICCDPQTQVFGIADIYLLMKLRIFKRDPKKYQDELAKMPSSTFSFGDEYLDNAIKNIESTLIGSEGNPIVKSTYRWILDQLQKAAREGL